MVRPTHYRLTLEPDLKNFSYKGTVDLTLTGSSPSQTLTLDAHQDLKVLSCTIRTPERQHEAPFVRRGNILTVKGPIKDKCILSFTFSGVLADSLTGWYRSTFFFKGRRGHIATTQFEAAEAKRVFPCKDHPSYKATFDVSLVIPKRLTALSNTFPIREESMNSHKKKVTFETTPVMSTYLLYLGVGEWEVWEKSYGRVTVSGVTTPGKSKHTSFAVDWAAKCLAFYEHYFKHPYPLKKLDLIAVPDFASGAMENWGAITFRENALLYYEGASSIATKQRIAEVVAHEIVHQWFGNLVTMKWWDDLWLNESFATYMAYKAIDHYFPEWNIWSEYVSYAYFGGMALDSLKSSHPIRTEVKRAEDIDELFDEIAYEKGGSVLRMLDEYLGEEVFRKGLRAYISRFAYANAEAQDLWSALSSVSKVPVEGIIRKFLNQTGFPQVTVAEKKNAVYFTQERFTFLPSQNRSLWDIPLVIRTSKNKIYRQLMRDKRVVNEVPITSETYINHDYAGFFITSYSDAFLQNLGKNRDKMSTVNKIGLLHDLFALLLSLKKSKSSLLTFISAYFKDESDPECLTYLIAKLMGLYFLVPDVENRNLIVHFSQEALRLVGHSPLAKENPKVTALRNGALSSLAFFDDPKTEAFLKEKFELFVRHKKEIEPDLRAVVYGGVVWQDSAYYERIVKLYRDSLIVEEQIKLLMALGNVKEKDKIKETLDFSLTEEVRFANILYVIVATSRNPLGKTVTYQWIKDNWGELKKRTGGHANNLLRRILQTVIPTGAIGLEKDALSFLEKNPIVGLEKTYAQIREELMVYSRFTKRYGG